MCTLMEECGCLFLHEELTLAEHLMLQYVKHLQYSYKLISISIL